MAYRVTLNIEHRYFKFDFRHGIFHCVPEAHNLIIS